MANPIPQPPSAADLQGLARDPILAQRLSQFLQALWNRERSVAIAEQQRALDIAGQFDSSRPIPVVGAFGTQYGVPTLGAQLSIGQIVHVNGQQIVPANYTDDSPGVSFIIGKSKDGSTVDLAQGFSAGPLQVTTPVVGDQVLLYLAGRGTCDPALIGSGTGSTQVIGVCNGTTVDPNGCVRCQNVGVGGLTTADFPDGFVRMNVVNTQTSGLPRTEWNGNNDGALLDMTNNYGTGGGVIAGHLPNAGSGTVFSADGTGGAVGYTAIMAGGAAFTGENTSALVGTIAVINQHGSGPHAQFGGAPSGVWIYPKIIRLYNTAGTFYIDVTSTNATANRTQTHQDADGTIALLEVAQTWSAAQTFSDNAIMSKRAIYTANTQTITAVTDTVDPNVSPSIRLTKATAGNITFTSLPTVLDGAVDEQEIVIQVDESSSANFVFTRDASLSGSGLFLGAATRTVRPGGALVLRWNADRDGWEEISFITTTT